MKEELNEKFRILSKFPKKDIVDDCHLLIQQFVVSIYLRKFDFIDLDELGYQMFVNSSSNDLRTLPPSKEALFQDLLRYLIDRFGYGGIHCCRKLFLRRSHGVGGFTVGN